jgi:hypothetical protein
LVFRDRNEAWQRRAVRKGGTHAVDAAAFAELTVASRRTSNTSATANSLNLPFSHYLKF